MAENRWHSWMQQPDIQHVYPLHDSREHDTSGNGCWCGPRIQHTASGQLVIHQAADGRQTQEGNFLHGAN